MREILFRGKEVRTGKWIVGFYCPCVFSGFPATPSIIDKERMDNGCWTPDRVIPETVGQFSGLTDKNGKRIFEGDIVSIIEGVGRYSREYRYIVKWELNGFYPFADSPENCGHCGGAYNSSESEVIGNIHDNPELLEVE